MRYKPKEKSSEREPSRELIDQKQVMSMMGNISRSTLYRYRKEESFPNPVKFKGLVKFWKDEINEYLESQRIDESSG